MPRIARLGVQALRLAMSREGLTWAELAARAGVDAGGLRVAACRGCPHFRMRLRLEAALKYRHPIWTDSGALADRARCVRVFGLDPVLVSRPALVRLAATHGFDFGGCRRKKDFVAAVVARAAVVGCSVKNK
jgi:hypothetical protein